MTTPTVQTLGPADPNAPVIAKVYTVVSSLLGLVTLASTFHLITTDQANAVSNLGTSAVGLIGAGITAVAAFRTSKQVKNGTFDKAPDPVVITQSPITNAFQSVAELKDHVDTAVADSVTKVKDAVGVIQGAAALLPGASGVLGSAVVEAGSLVDQFLHGDREQS
jgi:hypothetical protein